MKLLTLLRGALGLVLSILLVSVWVIAYSEDSESVSLWSGAIFIIPLAAWLADWIERRTRRWGSTEQPEHPDWEIRDRGDDLGDDVFL